MSLSSVGRWEQNFVAYKNEKADDLIVKIRQEYDKEKQVEYCHQLHRIIYEDQPYTFLYVGKWTALLDKKIVIKEEKPGGAVVKKIKATKTGDYTYHFNKWIKLKGPPVFTEEQGIIGFTFQWIKGETNEIGSYGHHL